MAKLLSGEALANFLKKQGKELSHEVISKGIVSGVGGTKIGKFFRSIYKSWRRKPDSNLFWCLITAPAAIVIWPLWAASPIDLWPDFLPGGWIDDTLIAPLVVLWLMYVRIFPKGWFKKILVKQFGYDPNYKPKGPAWDDPAIKKRKAPWE